MTRLKQLLLAALATSTRAWPRLDEALANYPSIHARETAKIKAGDKSAKFVLRNTADVDPDVQVLQCEPRSRRYTLQSCLHTLQLNALRIALPISQPLVREEDDRACAGLLPAVPRSRHTKWSKV